jgi:hypothetical protein
LHAAEEGLKRQIDAYRHILQDLRVHPCERGPSRLEGGQCRLLVVQPQRFLALLPGATPRGQQFVVQPAALFKLPL